MVDADGHPAKYDQMEIMSNFVAKEVNVLKIDVPESRYERGWKRTFSEIDCSQDADLGDAWRRDISTGCQHVLRET